MSTTERCTPSGMQVKLQSNIKVQRLLYAVVCRQLKLTGQGRGHLGVAKFSYTSRAPLAIAGSKATDTISDTGILSVHAIYKQTSENRRTSAEGEQLKSRKKGVPKVLQSIYIKEECRSLRA